MAFQDSPPVASDTTLEISKGYELGVGFGHAAGQTYYLSAGLDCRQWKRAGYLTWITGEAKTLPVEPDRPMVVFSETARTTGGNHYLFTSTCWGASSFTPLSGHHYRARFVAPATGRCYMQVEDSQTNAPIATPLKIGPGLCEPPERSEAAGYIREVARRTADTGSHSRDLYVPTQSSPIALPPPPPAPRPPIGWPSQASQVVPPIPEQPVAASQPAPLDSWARSQPTSPPNPSEAGRVVEIRVNADGSVNEIRDH